MAKTRPDKAPSKTNRTKQEGGGLKASDTQAVRAAPLANHVPAGQPVGDTLTVPAGRDDTSGAGHSRPDTQALPARPARTKRTANRATAVAQRGAGHASTDARDEPARPARTTGRKGHVLPDTRRHRALPAIEHDDAGRPSVDTRLAPAGVVAKPPAPPATPPSGWPGSPDENPIVAAIRFQYRFRNGAMLAVNRLEAQARAYVRTALGYSTLMPEPERNRISAEATAVIESVLTAADLPPHLQAEADAVRPFVVLIRDSTDPLKRSKLGAEQELERLVELLPVWDGWAKGVKGLSQMGVATYVGECGDLLTYSNPGKMWARLGLAPRPYYARLDSKGAEYHAVPKVRRSRSWSITDILLRHPGPYQDLYRQRKADEAQARPEWHKGINPKTGRLKVAKPAEMRAKRYAEKRMVRDLWRAWWRAAGVEPAILPHAQDKTAAGRAA